MIRHAQNMPKVRIDGKSETEFEAKAKKVVKEVHKQAFEA